jgi:hypothetical protein
MAKHSISFPNILFLHEGVRHLQKSRFVIANEGMNLVTH